MRFHFDFAAWFRMLRLAWGEDEARTRRRFLRVLLVNVPLVAGFHAICFFLDGILFPGLWRTRVTAPVFVLGHARSGTTLVHRLMSLDAGRFSAFRLYELHFPSLLQKKLIRLLGAVDRRWLGGRIEARVGAWEERRYRAVRAVHRMGLREVEEDDIVLYWSCASGFWITKLPYMGEVDFYWVDRWPARKRRRLMRFYRDCVRRQLHLNGGDRIHLSKNPIFAGRVEALLETFPDARFVVPLRNPLETIPSLLALVRSGWKGLGWDAARQERCLRLLAEQSFHTYRHPLEVLARHPETPRALVDYRRLVQDPAASVAQIYRELGLPMTEAFRERLVAEGERQRGHVSGHRYDLVRFGLDEGAIRSELADLFERYAWDEGPAAEPAR